MWRERVLRRSGRIWTRVRRERMPRRSERVWTQVPGRSGRVYSQMLREEERVGSVDLWSIFTRVYYV